MQPDQTMVVIYDRYFIFTLFSLLFLLIFSIFQFPSVVSAADDFFGIFPEDYYDPEDYGEKSTTVHEQLDVNNTIDQDNLITTEDKSRNVTSTLPEDSKDINFIAAGDWNCNKETQRTITKITNLEPELVLGLGDYTFKNVSPRCWFDISKPIDKILKIAIGNHDLDYHSSYSQLLEHYNLSLPYYSFNFHNIHFIAVSSEHPFEPGSKQYKYIKNDLEKSLHDSSILWRIVFLHTPMYTSASFDEKKSEDLKKVFHHLFEKFGVDLVLSGHTQYYQRSLSLSYNSDNPVYPIVKDQNNNNGFTSNDGIVFITAGTAGDELHKIAHYLPYYVIQEGKFGFLNFDLINNGHTLVGKFYDTDDVATLDKFVISKDTTGNKMYSEENNEQNNNYNNNNNNYYYTSHEEREKSDNPIF